MRRDCWIALILRRGHDDSLVKNVILILLSRIGCYGYDRGGTVYGHMPFFYPPLGLGAFGAFGVVSVPLGLVGGNFFRMLGADAEETFRADSGVYLDILGWFEKVGSM